MFNKTSKENLATVQKPARLARRLTFHLVDDQTDRRDPVALFLDMPFPGILSGSTIFSGQSDIIHTYVIEWQHCNIGFSQIAFCYSLQLVLHVIQHQADIRGWSPLRPLSSIATYRSSTVKSFSTPVLTLSDILSATPISAPLHLLHISPSISLFRALIPPTEPCPSFVPVSVTIGHRNL